MICVDCGYEIPFSLMKEKGIKKVACTICGATNTPKPTIPCISCGEDIAFSRVKNKNGKHVQCLSCMETHNYKIDDSAHYRVVPSVRDLLEDPETAMVPSSRAQQVKIARAIEEALHDGTSCIAEAGTGTGKTLAYLVPALSMGKRVIVATATKALQDQIMEEDGPWVLGALEEMGIHRNIAVLKGKENFACLDRFRYHVKQGNIPKDSAEEKAAVARMEDWFEEAEEETHNADLNAYSDPPEWVDKVKVKECGKSKCRRCNLCGYYRNLKQVESADVVVTNHTLVALEYMIPAQLGESGSGLKDFLFGDRHAIIFDEAHQLESAFENVWKDEINMFTVKRTLKKLGGLFPPGPDPKSVSDREYTTIAYPPPHALADVADDEDARKEAARERRIKATIEVGCTYKNMWETGAYDPKMGKTLLKGMKRLGEALSYNSSDTATLDPDEVPLVKRALCQIYAALRRIQEGFSTYYDSLEKEVKEAQSKHTYSQQNYDELMQEYYELRPLNRRVERWIDLATSWLFMREDHVYYVKRDTHPDYDTSYSMVRQPIDLAKVLRGFWNRHESVIFSSATMSNKVGGKPSFSLFQSRLGTHIPEENCVAVKSPFNFKSRCATYFTRDNNLRPPKYNASKRKKEEYFDNMAEEIGYWTALTRGNALVLFASAYDLEQVYNRLVADERLSKYPIHAQKNDEVPAAVAFERYMADARKLVSKKPRIGPILLGLQSFWEVVSIKGPLLLNVILTRMPFPVPTDPLFQKRQEKLGDHSFRVQSLYPVSISARQGTGRLLRTIKDAGIVAVLDARISSSRWGAQIIRELDVAENRFFSKDKMKAAWKHVDNYTQKMLDKTNL